MTSELIRQRIVQQSGIKTYPPTNCATKWHQNLSANELCNKMTSTLIRHSPNLLAKFVAKLRYNRNNSLRKIRPQASNVSIRLLLRKLRPQASNVSIRLLSVFQNRQTFPFNGFNSSVVLHNCFASRYLPAAVATRSRSAVFHNVFSTIGCCKK